MNEAAKVCVHPNGIRKSLSTECDSCWLHQPILSSFALQFVSYFVIVCFDMVKRNRKQTTAKSHKEEVFGVRFYVSFYVCVCVFVPFYSKSWDLIRTVSFHSKLICFHKTRWISISFALFLIFRLEIEKLSKWIYAYEYAHSFQCKLVSDHCSFLLHY